MRFGSKTEASRLMAVGRKTGGRKKGTPNKTTALLKDAILKAAEAAGGEPSKTSPGGVVAYLTEQAKANPSSFMTLLGKVLPTQLTGEVGGPVQTEDKTNTESALSILERRIAVLAARHREAALIDGRSTDTRLVG
jgi:hypothetical protein